MAPPFQTSSTNNPGRRGIPATTAAPQRFGRSNADFGQTPTLGRGRVATASAAVRPQTEPRRTPRASLAAAAATAAGPQAPFTPGALTGAQLQRNQLVRTPATASQQLFRSSAARQTGQPKSRWRASLAGAAEAEARRKIDERREIVRAPATDALEQLLMVGRNASGLKAAYFSDAAFLETKSLAQVLPQEVNDPTSQLNGLVRLANVTTFLHLVLTAAPDKESGVSSRSAVSQLKQATDALLRHVKPPQDPVSDTALKLLVDLKCQTYIAAASASRTPIDPKPYFAAPLSSHLVHAASIAMTDRSASAKFSMLQAAALNTILATEGDWQVLRTKWTWEATAREARDWVEGIVLDSGLGSAAALTEDVPELDERDAYTQAEQLAMEGTGDEPASEADPFGGSEVLDRQANDALEEEDRELGPRASSEEPELVIAEAAPAAADEEPSAVESSTEDAVLIVEEIERVEVAVGQEREPEQERAGDGGEEGDDSQDAPDFRQAEGNHAQEAAVGAAEAPDETQEKALSPARSLPADLEDSIDDIDEDGRVESFLQLLNNAHDEKVRQLIDDPSGTADESERIVQPAVDEDRQDELSESDENSRADELVRMLDEGVEPAKEEPVPSSVADVESQTVAPDVIMREAQANHLRIGPGNRLYMESGPRQKTSLLERQPDAERIEFDTQSLGDDREEPVAGPSGLKSGHERIDRSRDELSPEQPRGQARRSDSLSHGATYDGREDRDRDVGPTGPERRPPHGDPDSFEPDYYEPEYGGGFDEEEGNDMAEYDEEEVAPPPRQKQKQKQKEAQPARRPPLSQVNPAGTKDAASRSAAFVASQRAAPPRSGPRREEDGFDSASSSDESDPGRTSQPARIQNSYRKRARQQDVLSDDELPPARKQRRQRSREGSESPQPPPPERSANIYFQNRNQPGARRDWTPEETKKLHEAIKSFGSSWKRIMELHGPHGTSSQIFKHRTNVSLKDKAVNECVNYLKTGMPLPKYLQCVTVPLNKLPKVAPQLRKNETDESEQSD